MATETSKLIVQVNLKDAIKDFEILDKRVNERNDSGIVLENQLLELEKEQTQVGTKLVSRQRNYATKKDKEQKNIKVDKINLIQNNERVN